MIALVWIQFLTLPLWVFGVPFGNVVFLAASIALTIVAACRWRQSVREANR